MDSNLDRHDDHLFRLRRNLRYSWILIGGIVLVLLGMLFLLPASFFSATAVAVMVLLSGAVMAYASWRMNQYLSRGIDSIFNRRQESRARLEAFLSGFREVLTGFDEGDLTISLEPLDEFPEYRQLKEVLESILQVYIGIFSKIQKTSAEVSINAHRILETSGEQASGSSEQAAAVAEITSAMEELARTAAQIAENAGQVVLSSEDAEKRAGEGMDNTRRNTASLERMNERMSDINKNAHQLGEKFQEIDKILALITSIASETHILALNAAIEAASAGEYGARFSVIAGEVRRLSDMSQEAVDEIKSILTDFQKSIQNTILATEQGTKEFDSAIESAFQIQEKLEGIVGKVGQTTRAAKEISLATQQQKTASDQIVETLKDVSIVTRQIASALQEFNKSANRLDTLAMGMQLIPQNFTLPLDRNIKYIAKQTVNKEEITNFKKQNVTAVLGDILDQYPFIELIYVADHEGNLSSFAVPEHLKSDRSQDVLSPGANYAQRPWFYTPVESGKTYITTMYKSALTGEDCITISTPIRNSDEQISGVLGIDINASMWSRIE